MSTVIQALKQAAIRSLEAKTELTVEEAKTLIIVKRKGILRLPHLKKLTHEVAAILSEFEGDSIYFKNSKSVALMTELNVINSIKLKKS